MVQKAQAGALLINGKAMKKAIIILAFFGALCACEKPAPNKEVATEVEAPKKGERVTANLDVDPIATEKFRADLIKEFPTDTPTENIEKALSAKKYDCGPDPVSPNERACTNAETQDKCMLLSIVRTLPYKPEGAQIIKACGMVNQE